MNGKRIMLIGAYSMELVECGGTLLKNVLDGGESHACIMFASEKMQNDLKKSAEKLKTSVDFLDFNTYDIAVSSEYLEKVVYQIRKFKPEIVICQDPDTVNCDLDPGRRIAMTVILDSLAHASRDFAIDKMPELSPCPIPPIYYMMPHHPNCLVNIANVWDEKCEAMDLLEGQLEFSGMLYDKMYDKDILKKIVPNIDELETNVEKGKFIKRELDKALHLSYAISGHSELLFTEAFRRQGCFNLDNLKI